MAERAHPPFSNYQPAICGAPSGGGRRPGRPGCAEAAAPRAPATGHRSPLPPPPGRAADTEGLPRARPGPRERPASGSPPAGPGRRGQGFALGQVANVSDGALPAAALPPPLRLIASVRILFCQCTNFSPLLLFLTPARSPCRG